jgi:hypothetical protein
LGYKIGTTMMRYSKALKYRFWKNHLKFTKKNYIPVEARVTFVMDAKINRRSVTRLDERIV